MKRAFTFLLVTVIAFLSLWGCNKAGSNSGNKSYIQNSQPEQQQPQQPPQQNSSNGNSQPVGSTDANPKTSNKKETIWSLIDENRVEDITPVFENHRYILDVEAFRSERYKNIDCSELSFFKVNGRTGVIDSEGNIKIPYEDNVGWCMEGFVDEKHCPYDSEFKKEAQSGHGTSTHMFDLNTHKLVDYNSDGNCFIDINYCIKNNISLAGICKAAYFKAGGPELSIEKETDYYIVIDDKGNPITGPDIQDGTSFYNGISAIKKNNKWGFIDLKGTMVLKFQYDYAYNLIDGIAAVCKDGKWGYINKDGSIYKNFIYDATRSFYKGKAWAKLNGKWQIIKE